MKRQNISVPSVPRTIRKHPGFTLIELLVVVAIIAILASLLLPALTRAKKTAHIAGCVSNLKQMGVSILVYASDHQDDMPLIYERYYWAPLQRGFVGGGHGWIMFGILLTRTDIPMDAFRCPADRRNYELTERNFYNIGPGITWQEQLFDYSANSVGHGMSNRRLPWSLPLTTSPNPGLNLKHSSIPNTSTLRLVWDGHIPFWNISSGWAQLKGGLGTATTISKDTHAYDTTFRHADFVDDEGSRSTLKGPNTLFADGHVEQRINFHNLTDDNFNLPAN